MTIKQAAPSIVLPVATAVMAVLAAVGARADGPGETKCGFLAIDNLPVQQGTVECKPSSRTGSGGRGMSTIDSADFVARLAPGDSYLHLIAEHDVDGVGGFRLSSDAQLRANAQNWANPQKGKNYTDVIGSPFRHLTFNIFDNGDWACAWGEMESSKKAWGGGGARSYALVLFCERG